MTYVCIHTYMLLIYTRYHFMSQFCYLDPIRKHVCCLLLLYIFPFICWIVSQNWFGFLRGKLKMLLPFAPRRIPGWSVANRERWVWIPDLPSPFMGLFPHPRFFPEMPVYEHVRIPSACLLSWIQSHVSFSLLNSFFMGR